MSNMRQLEEDVIEILETLADKRYVAELYLEDVSEDKFTTREFDELMNFVSDGLDYMLKNSRHREDDIIASLIMFKASDYVLKDRELERKLNDREVTEAEKDVRKAEDLLEAMEDDRSRGGRRGSRDRDSRRDDGRSGGYDRGFREEREERGGRRGGRDSGRGRSGNYTPRAEREEAEERMARREANLTRGRRSRDSQAENRVRGKQVGPVVLGDGEGLNKLRAILTGRTDEPTEEAAPATNSRGPSPMPTPEQVNTPREERPTRTRPAATFVHQDSPAAEQPVTDPEVKTRAEWVELGYNVDDEAFILDLPVKPETFEDPTRLPYFFEPDAKRPKWVCSAEGYRELTFRDIDMNLDDAMIPDFGKPASLDKVKPATALLKGTAATYRYQPLEVAADLENQRKVFEQEVAEWEEANKDVPEDQRAPKPVLVMEGDEVNQTTIAHAERVTSFSLNETKVKVACTLAEIGVNEAPNTNVEVDARELEFVFQFADDAEFLECVEALRLFQPSSASESVRYAAYHDRLISLRGQIPTALWIALNRRLTQVVNDTIRGNLGLPAQIDDFAEDGKDFLADMRDQFGQGTLEKLEKYGRQMFRQFHFVVFKPGDIEGLPPRCVYFMERQHLLFMPFSAPELGVVTTKSGEGTPSRVFRLSRQAAPTLYKAINSFTMQESSTDEHFGIARKLVLADGTVLELFRSWYDPNESEYLVRVAK